MKCLALYKPLRKISLIFVKPFFFLKQSDLIHQIGTGRSVAIYENQIHPHRTKMSHCGGYSRRKRKKKSSSFDVNAKRISKKVTNKAFQNDDCVQHNTLTGFKVPSSPHRHTLKQSSWKICQETRLLPNSPQGCAVTSQVLILRGELLDKTGDSLSASLKPQRSRFSLQGCQNNSKSTYN